MIRSEGECTIREAAVSDAPFLARLATQLGRGSGIGARLIAEAETWAASQGYALMRVRSNVKRNRARRFYERAGFKLTKRQRNFEKRLEDPGQA